MTHFPFVLLFLITLGILDKVFGFDCTTQQVYVEGAKDVSLSVVNGINGEHKVSKFSHSISLMA